MKKWYLFLAITALAAATLACSVNITLPETSVKTGPTETEVIHISEPDGAEVDLTIALGAGDLKIRPGTTDELVSGDVRYNVTDFKPETEIEGDKIRLNQGNLEFDGIPTFNNNIINEWDLRLGDLPMTLRLKAGAYSADLDLGGLNLKNLYVEDGASSVDILFSEPNKTEMGILDYSTGASTVKLEGLGNANFSTLVFKSGLGDYTLDFTGDLRRDANVKVDSGLSNVEIYIPAGVNARVTIDSGLTNVSTRGDWTTSGNTYTLPGDGPTLTIQIKIGAGNVELRTD